MEKTIKSSALNYGLYLGLVLTLITIIVYSVNLGIFVKWQFSIGLFLLIVIVGIISAIKSRKILGGFITFKNAFMSYFITVAVGVLVSTIVGIIIFNFIDTDAAKELNEKILLVTKESMERFGAPEDKIQEALAKAQEKDNFAIGKQIQNYFIGLVIYSLFGLIAALVIKKNDPEKA